MACSEIVVRIQCSAFHFNAVCSIPVHPFGGHTGDELSLENAPYCTSFTFLNSMSVTVPDGVACMVNPSHGGFADPVQLVNRKRKVSRSIPFIVIINRTGPQLATALVLV